MLPSSTGRSVPNRRPVHAESLSQLARGVRRPASPDLSYLTLGELASVDPLAPRPAFGVPTGAVFVSGRGYMSAFLHLVPVVVSPRPQPEMVRTHAPHVIAVVEDARLFSRNRTICNLPSDAVGSVALAAHPEFGVPPRAPAQSPDPTRPEVRHVFRDRPVLVDLCPEIGHGILGFTHRRASIQGSGGQGRSGVTSTRPARSLYQ